jgi:hypothetical protein
LKNWCHFLSDAQETLPDPPQITATDQPPLMKHRVYESYFALDKELDERKDVMVPQEQDAVDEQDVADSTPLNTIKDKWNTVVAFIRDGIIDPDAQYDRLDDEAVRPTSRYAPVFCEW